MRGLLAVGVMALLATGSVGVTSLPRPGAEAVQAWAVDMAFDLKGASSWSERFGVAS